MIRMKFPQFISFTVTNACNLRCRMCGQWSEKGYVRSRTIDADTKMTLADWKRLVDEISGHDIRFVLIRGGEPFLFPDIMELLEYIYCHGLFISIDTNGTLLREYIADLVHFSDKMHITFSVDGPEEIHDQVRCVRGAYQTTKNNIAVLLEAEKNRKQKISKSICFTISPCSYRGLGKMPGVARSMAIHSINIVPYYYCPETVGRKYEEELMQHFQCQAFSWRGFHHDRSGIDFNIFRKEYREYLDNLNGISNFPYMPLTENQYRSWFDDPLSPVGSPACMNVEKLIDIQPDGRANFCVDFPDYSMGNVTESAIGKIWNSPEAERFRQYRRKKPLAICYRCGARYISEIQS